MANHLNAGMGDAHGPIGDHHSNPLTDQAPAARYVRAIDANGQFMGFRFSFRRDAKNLHGFGKFVSAVSACDPSPEELMLGSQAKSKKVQRRFPWAEEEAHLFLRKILTQTVILKGYSYDRHLHVRTS